MLVRRRLLPLSFAARELFEPVDGVGEVAGGFGLRRVDPAARGLEHGLGVVATRRGERERVGAAQHFSGGAARAQVLPRLTRGDAVPARATSCFEAGPGAVPALAAEVFPESAVRWDAVAVGVLPLHELSAPPSHSVVGGLDVGALPLQRMMLLAWSGISGVAARASAQVIALVGGAASRRSSASMRGRSSLITAV